MDKEAWTPIDHSSFLSRLFIDKLDHRLENQGMDKEASTLIDHSTFLDYP